MNRDYSKGFFIKLFLSLVLLTVFFFALYSFLALQKELSVSQTIIEIEEGTSLRELVEELHERKIINNPKTARIILQAMGFQKKIKAGVYETHPKETLWELISKISSGKVKLFSFTIIEGSNFLDIITRLTNESSIKPMNLDSIKDGNFLSSLNIEYSSPEGLFFPDTYYYPYGSGARLLLEMSKRKMEEVLDAEWNNRDHNLPFASKYEALIMASIVEKETADSSERTTISGVFSNRLKKGMRLQSDPTVIYGLGKTYQGNIKKIHLRQKTAYNTYRIKGLPPTPIAMPGKESIRAALQPKKTNALYFVSKGDGSHVFSSSLNEHNKAVDRYQRDRRNGKR